MTETSGSNSSTASICHSRMGHRSVREGEPEKRLRVVLDLHVRGCGARCQHKVLAWLQGDEHTPRGANAEEIRGDRPA